MADHAGFIIAAYAVTALVLAGMLLAILLDYRAQRRSLASLTERLDQRKGAPPAPTGTRGQPDDEP